MATVTDPLGWEAIARALKASGDPAYANWVDPQDPIGVATAPPPTVATGPAALEPSITPVATAPGSDTAGAMSRGVYDSIAQYLTAAGLGQLFTLGTDGTPGGWLWDQIVGGNDTAAGLQAAIEATDVFKARYPVIAEARAALASGTTTGLTRVPTVAEVRDYEETVARTMRLSGLPGWMYDEHTELQGFMANGLSAPEIEGRLGSAWTQVRDVSPIIRQTFEEFYGVGQGDGALAAFFLDPERTITKLDTAARTAYTAGMGRTLGIDVDKALAERVAALPKTEGGIFQDLTEVNRLGGVFTEGITETTDLTDRTGIESVTFGDANATGQIERRILERQANERSSQGGAATTQRGVTGLSSA